MNLNDILKPEVLCIEGRCYRVNDPTAEVNALQEHDLYEHEAYNEYEMDEDEDDDFEINMVDSSRFCTRFHIAKHYIGSIIGKKGAIKNTIERDTKTDIKIPRQGQEGDIVIFGSSESNVKAARRRINLIVMSSRMKQRPTHFLSVPMNSPEIKTNFEKFKEMVLRECPSRGLDDSLFIPCSKLHLTLGVTCLMDDEERHMACKLLTEAKEKIVIPLVKDHFPIRIRLKGLSYMNDDPAQIDVLYGKVNEEGGTVGLIQTLADELFGYFYRAGFMKEEHDRNNIKLHVTLINSKYRIKSSTNLDTESGSRNSRKPRETFDGSSILSKFGDYDFGVAEFKEIHLSQRHAMSSDGYYQSTCVITCE